MLGADSRLSQKQDALYSISDLCGDQDSMAALVAAGVIPPLVRLLADGPTVDAQLLQCNAAAALSRIAANGNAGNAATVAAAGAIPTVQLLGPGYFDQLRCNAGGLLCGLANADNAATIASLGAIPPLVRMQSPAGMQEDFSIVKCLTHPRPPLFCVNPLQQHI
jgi:hypothetical protein